MFAIPEKISLKIVELPVWTFSALFVLLIVFITVLILHAFKKRLNVLESMRRRTLKSKDEPGAIPLEFNKSVDPKREVVSKQLKRLETRFTITRRTVYISFISLALLIVAFPLIENASPGLFSVAIACLSVIIGIAAKPFVENLICGLVFSFGKLAKIGDTVTVDGEYGVIEDITLTHCIIKRWDWLRYVVPNSSMMTKEFINYSLIDDFRWVYVEFWVHYDSDISLVEAIAKAAPLSSKCFSGNEDPRFWIVEMGKEAVKCLVVAWATAPADGWMLSIDIRKELMLQFHKHGIRTHEHNFLVADPGSLPNTVG